jgi:hypothetical protein
MRPYRLIWPLTFRPGKGMRPGMQPLERFTLIECDPLPQTEGGHGRRSETPSSSTASRSWSRSRGGGSPGDTDPGAKRGRTDFIIPICETARRGDFR